MMRLERLAADAAEAIDADADGHGATSWDGDRAAGSCAMTSWAVPRSAASVGRWAVGSAHRLRRAIASGRSSAVSIGRGFGASALHAPISGRRPARTAAERRRGRRRRRARRHDRTRAAGIRNGRRRRPPAPGRAAIALASAMAAADDDELRVEDVDERRPGGGERAPSLGHERRRSRDRRRPRASATSRAVSGCAAPASAAAAREVQAAARPRSRRAPPGRSPAPLL